MYAIRCTKTGAFFTTNKGKNNWVSTQAAKAAFRVHTGRNLKDDSTEYELVNIAFVPKPTVKKFIHNLKEGTVRVIMNDGSEGDFHWFDDREDILSHFGIYGYRIKLEFNIVFSGYMMAIKCLFPEIELEYVE